MTEQEWLAATDPDDMIRYLRGKYDRKLRLLFCASCRSIWNLAGGHHLRHAVEVGERMADGLASPDEVQLVRRELCPNTYFSGDKATATAYSAVSENFPVWAISHAVELHATNAVKQARSDGLGALPAGTRTEVRKEHRELIRCVFGNPFRPVILDPSWRTEAVVALAWGIYEDRGFDRLPVLADALEDAGCADPDVLTHCRGDGPHVRGCWVVDAVLGKE